MVYKSVNKQTPTYLTEMSVKLSDSCKRELRNTKAHLAVPRCKLALERNASHIRVINYGMIFKFQPNLPKQIKCLKNISAM